MPSNINSDKQIDNLEQASETDEKFIAFKKRMFWSGVFPLIAAIALSLPIPINKSIILNKQVKQIRNSSLLKSACSGLELAF